MLSLSVPSLPMLQSSPEANLENFGVQLFTNYDEMLKIEGLQEVCIASRDCACGGHQGY
jgi:hypothetical protein